MDCMLRATTNTLLNQFNNYLDGIHRLAKFIVFSEVVLAPEIQAD